jgi:thiamine-phosphate pyrophosphorylase
MHRLPRLIDANLNRTTEGLRVCEDIARFMLNERTLSGCFKSLRHGVGELSKRLYAKKNILLKSRNVKKDVGKKTAYNENKRAGIPDVFHANIQRAKESLRVLEETTKLVDTKVAEGFKKIRFRVYELEKKSRPKLEALLHH